jgi:hypothetical protein
MSVVFAKSTCSIGGPHGGTVDLVAGEPWDANDPVVQERPEFFSKKPVRVKTSGRGWMPVEQATAAPGEKRRTR